MANLNFKSPALWLATWFGCGLLKPAPGTWGTLGALPVGLALLTYGGWVALLAGIIAVTLTGLWAARELESQTGQSDPGMIVIDEVAGMWITMLALPLIGWVNTGQVCPTGTPECPYMAFTFLSWLPIILAFILFRAFDILKPWPVSWCDQKLPGAWGVMTDDLVAGILAAAVLWGIYAYVL